MSGQGLDPETLNQVRADIDALDDGLHDLIMRRTEVVARVAAAKAAANGGVVGFAVRPGREAQMRRRLYERHDGALPFSVIARLWREMINAKTRLQSPLSVVMADEDPRFGHADFIRRFDLVRSHWGTATPVAQLASIDQVVAAVSAEHGVMGVIDRHVEVDWWLPLVSARRQGAPGPFVVAPVPFVLDSTHPHPVSFALGPLPPEPSGDDITMLAAFGDDPARAAREAGLSVEAASAGLGGASGLLLEISGFFSHEDRPLADLRERLGGELHYLGAYARPLHLG